MFFGIIKNNKHNIYKNILIVNNITLYNKNYTKYFANNLVKINKNKIMFCKF
jgi:hypothetical protein